MKVRDVHVFRVAEGEDLVQSIVDYSRKNHITCASVMVIGALKNAELGYFSKELGEYVRTEVDEQCELISGMGNISTREEEVFLHLHVLLGKRDFTTVGGHLIKGEVFVGEVIIHEYDGRCPRNKHGSLYLWDVQA